MRLPALVAVALATACLSGCSTSGSDAVFGPEADPAAALADAAGPPSTVSMTAKPAQGPAPLAVAFSIQVLDARGAVPWSVDFGDGSQPARGKGLAAAVQHIYVQEGRYHAFITLGEGAEATTGTLAVTVLPPGTAVEGPPEEVVAEQVAGPPSGSSSTGPSSSSSSDTGTTPSPQSNDPDPSPDGTSTSSSSSKPPKDDEDDGEPTSTSSSTSSSGSATEPPTNSSSPNGTSSPTESTSPSESESPTTSESPSSSESASTSASESPSPTENPPPPEGMPEASLVADPASAPAPANVTYTVNATDPDGDELAWQFMVDGVELGNGTGADLPRSFWQIYDVPGNHTAAFTVSDGLNTVWWEVLVTITDPETDG